MCYHKSDLWVSNTTVLQYCKYLGWNMPKTQLQLYQWHTWFLGYPTRDASKWDFDNCGRSQTPGLNGILIFKKIYRGSTEWGANEGCKHGQTIPNEGPNKQTNSVSDRECPLLGGSIDCNFLIWSLQTYVLSSLRFGKMGHFRLILLILKSPKHGFWVTKSKKLKSIDPPKSGHSLSELD